MGFNGYLISPSGGHLYCTGKPAAGAWKSQKSFKTPFSRNDSNAAANARLIQRI
jgi:hypothetical protein